MERQVPISERGTWIEHEPLQLRRKGVLRFEVFGISVE